MDDVLTTEKGVETLVVAKIDYRNAPSERMARRHGLELLDAGLEIANHPLRGWYTIVGL
ncbi:hypothetical protein ACFXKJ_01925 [Kitasatospora indigofera]|uniref:hypothetical protein n=1 Tax=Kitasatospora indigofera TaxID=67307 RepID=UPI0036CD983C